MNTKILDPLQNEDSVSASQKPTLSPRAHTGLVTFLVMLVLLAAVLGCCVDAKLYFRDVFGVAANETTILHRSVHQQLKEVSELERYQSSRSADSCTFPVEVGFLQDLSSRTSASTYLKHLTESQLPTVLADLKQANPSSKGFVLSFVDTPIGNLSTDNDCVNLRQTLTESDAYILGAFNQMETRPFDALSDERQNQLGVLTYAAASSQIEWTEDSSFSRVMILTTASAPHFAGDEENYARLMPWESQVLLDLGEKEFCKSFYYPSPIHAQVAIHARNAYLIVMYEATTPHGGVLDEGEREWRWFNGLLGQSRGMVRRFSRDGSDWSSQLIAAMAEIRAAECANNYCEEVCGGGECPCAQGNMILKGVPDHIHIRVDF